jgi:hypothetical protein
LGSRKNVLSKECLDAWDHLDELAKKQPLEDADKCGVIGDSILMTGSVVMEYIKEFAPDVFLILQTTLGI